MQHIVYWLFSITGGHGSSTLRNKFGDKFFLFDQLFGKWLPAPVVKMQKLQRFLKNLVSLKAPISVIDDLLYD